MSTLSQDSIAWAIEHLSRYSDTDILPRALEFDAIKHSKDEVAKSLVKQDICQWVTKPYRKCLVPKQRYGFRIATQLDPLDMVFFVSLCLEVGESIEKARIPVDQGISFSYRFKRDNSDYLFFDRNVGYSKYQAHSTDLLSKHSYVVITDIADFYPRIYLHRIENALNSATKRLPTHAKAIIQLLKGWNQNVSHGIPIGNNQSRLIAEIAIDDIDRTMLAEGMVFTRYVDDYRIFCNSRQEAYSWLAKLANALYDGQGLTLQSQKTKIMSASEFRSDVLETEEKKEVEALATSFKGIISQLGLDNPSVPLDYDSLPPDIQAQVEGLNLESLMEVQLQAEEVDLAMTRFLMNRMGQLQQVNLIMKILDETDKLFPVFSEAIRYLTRLEDVLPPDEREIIGGILLDKLEDSVVSQLEYHRMLILGLFADSHKWGNANKLARFYNSASDDWSRRALLLALGKAEQDYWLRTKKTQVDQMSPWEKRAFLYAASCFPKDEREHWYRAIKPRLNELEKLVIGWALDAPINS